MNDVMKEAFRKAGLEGKQPSDKSRAKETPPGNRSGMQAAAGVPLRLYPDRGYGIYIEG